MENANTLLMNLLNKIIYNYFIIQLYKIKNKKILYFIYYYYYIYIIIIYYTILLLLYILLLLFIIYFILKYCVVKEK